MKKLTLAAITLFLAQAASATTVAWDWTGSSGYKRLGYVLVLQRT